MTQINAGCEKEENGASLIEDWKSRRCCEGHVDKRRGEGDLAWDSELEVCEWECACERCVCTKCTCETEQY